MAGRNLDPEQLIQTIETLLKRITERFPEAGLRIVCENLLDIARQARKRSIEIGRPMKGIRILSGVFIATMLAGIVLLVKLIHIPNQPLPAGEFIQVIDAALGAMVLLGATLLFLASIEIRFKRARALKAIHELRSLVHIIDMHQLTKDPDRILSGDPSLNTQSSPKRTMSRFQLNRYLDYCSEMLALCGKIAALYVENFPDAQSVSAANDLENLTTSQGRKIWQKIMILHTIPTECEPGPQAQTGATENGSSLTKPVTSSVSEGS